MAAASKTKAEPRAYLISGDDDFRKERELEKLLADMIASDFADFDLEHLEGETATADRIMAGLGIPPFSSPRRVVLLRYANKMNEDEQEKLAERLDRVPSSGCLILISPAPEKADGKPRKGSEVVGEMSKAVRKVGKVIRVGGEIGRDKSETTRKFAQSLFENAGKKIDSNAFQAFVQRVGSDFSVLTSEARKLVDYAGSSDRITLADVSAVTSETPEEKIFRLVDAIGEKRPADAMALLDSLFDTGDRPDADAPRVLANIARQFRLVWQAKMLVESRVSAFRKDAVPEQIQALLPSSPNILELVARQSWQESRLKRQASNWTREQLSRGFQSVAKVDAALKGIEGDVEDPRMAMELLVLELAG